MIMIKLLDGPPAHAGVKRPPMTMCAENNQLSSVLLLHMADQCGHICSHSHALFHHFTDKIYEERSGLEWLCLWDSYHMITKPVMATYKSWHHQGHGPGQ
ncbi:hypothetical protein AKJ16_DCAP04510 [Drosera capensis]